MKPEDIKIQSIDTPGAKPDPDQMEADALMAEVQRLQADTERLHNEWLEIREETEAAYTKFFGDVMLAVCLVIVIIAVFGV